MKSGMLQQQMLFSTLLILFRESKTVTCNVMGIYEYATTDTPVIDLFCWDDWRASAIFRHTAAETITSSNLVLEHRDRRSKIILSYR